MSPAQLNGAENLQAQLATTGIVALEGVHGRPLFCQTVAALGVPRLHRDSDVDGITTIAVRPDAERAGFAGFGSHALNPHTEGSALARPPQLLALVCQSRADVGGHSVLVDGLRLYDYLVAEAPDALQALFQPRSVLFGGANGFLGSIFERTDERIRLRLRLDDLAQFSPDVAAHLPTLWAAIEATALRLTLAPGDGYVLSNSRWLHGRSGFGGCRVMLRLLADLPPTSPIADGFDPRGAPDP